MAGIQAALHIHVGGDGLHLGQGDREQHLGGVLGLGIEAVRHHSLAGFSSHLQAASTHGSLAELSSHFCSWLDLAVSLSGWLARTELVMIGRLIQILGQWNSYVVTRNISPHGWFGACALAAHSVVLVEDD